MLVSLLPGKTGRRKRGRQYLHGAGAALDLKDPEHVFHVEARSEEAFVFTEKREGVGGLPLGSQEPLVALVSGGIDSPVAAFEVMKRGSPVVPVSLDPGDYGGPDHRARMLSFRRYMFRVAEHVAERVDAAGVVTGKAIGQKSSQTARNLGVTSAATDLPIHRPLLAMDKLDRLREAEPDDPLERAAEDAAAVELIDPAE